MIEFALLFGLGFLSALLIAMLVGPAIHRRIVVYTENRIRATVPISPQEVRAQRDMARALYAAENARTKQELLQERDRTVSLKIKGETLQDEIKALVAENLDLKMRLDNTDIETADLRSHLRHEDSHIAELKAALDTSEENGVARDLEIENLRRELDVVGANHDNARIDLTTRETEIENLKFRISALREEREELRHDVRLQTTRAKEAETRYAQEESRALRLEDRLAREISDRTDKETALERRNHEIARLRDQLKDGGTAAPLDPQWAETRFTAVPTDAAVESPALPVEGDTADTGATGLMASLADEARNHATALSERLLNGKGAANDEALRKEMALIAANMVAMTALAEGKASPIHALLSDTPATDQSAAAGRKSLALRVEQLLATTGTPIPR